MKIHSHFRSWTAFPGLITRTVCLHTCNNVLNNMQGSQTKVTLVSLPFFPSLPRRLEAVDAARLLGLRSQAHAVPQTLLRVVHVVVVDGRVRRDPVVPERDGAGLPLYAGLEVLAQGDVLRRCTKLEEEKKGVLRGVAFVEEGVYTTPIYGVHTSKRRSRSAADSSSFRPTIRLVNPGLTYSTFCPVA